MNAAGFSVDLIRDGSRYQVLKIAPMGEFLVRDKFCVDSIYTYRSFAWAFKKFSSLEVKHQSSEADATQA